MIKTERFLYGTVEECVREIVSRIDWDNGVFPEFDFCDEPFDGLSEKEILECDISGNLGEGWFGCKDISHLFDADTFNLVFGWYSGGQLTVADLWDKEDAFLDIVTAIRNCTNGNLGINGLTVIDFKVGE